MPDPTLPSWWAEVVPGDAVFYDGKVWTSWEAWTSPNGGCMTGPSMRYYVEAGLVHPLVIGGKVVPT